MSTSKIEHLRYGSVVVCSGYIAIRKSTGHIYNPRLTRLSTQSKTKTTVIKSYYEEPSRITKVIYLERGNHELEEYQC